MKIPPLRMKWFQMIMVYLFITNLSIIISTWFSYQSIKGSWGCWFLLLGLSSGIRSSSDLKFGCGAKSKSLSCSFSSRFPPQSIAFRDCELRLSQPFESGLSNGDSKFQGWSFHSSKSSSSAVEFANFIHHLSHAGLSWFVGLANYGRTGALEGT